MKICITSTLLAVCAVSLLATSRAAAAISLSSAYVSPSMGHTGTYFRFYVTYKNTTGAAPTVKQVFIDGMGPFTMNLGSGSYITGAQYWYPAYLAPGAHNYRFYFATASESARLPSVGTVDGPVVSAAYNITDYFPLTGKWTYVTTYGYVNRTSLGGSPTVIWCRWIEADGTDWGDWFEHWSSSTSGVFWHGLAYEGDFGYETVWFDPPLRIPNGAYVGQTATTQHTAYVTGLPAVQGWFTYRVDGVGKISVPYGTADCLKVTLTISSARLSVREEMWLSRGVGATERVIAGAGLLRLLSRTP